ITATHSLIGDTSDPNLPFTGPTTPDPTTGNLVGSAASPIDPMLVLGPLQNNGGPTKTMALLPLSPAIDQGDDILTSLAAPRTVVAGTPQASDARSLGPGAVSAIAGEQRQVTAVNGTTVTVARGFGNTPAAPHAAGATLRLAFDQRGSPREVNARADMGAF